MSQDSIPPKDRAIISAPLPSSSTDDSRSVVIVAASMVLVTGLSVLVFNLVHETVGRTLLGIAMGAVALSIVLAFYQFLQPARIITSTAAFLIVTYFLIEGEGIHDASITAYAAVVILGGLLLGKAGVLLFGALTTLSLAGLAYAEYFGIVSNKYTGLFDVLDVNVIWFLHFATSVIVYILVRRLSRLADDARKGEREFARANEELSALHDVLQERVDRRTESLVAQNTILQASSRVSSEILSATEITEILQKSAELIYSEFEQDHVGIFLLNEKKDRAILQASSSDDERSKRMLGDSYKLPLDEASLVGLVATEKRARIALNRGADAIFFGDSTKILDAQSEIALPLMIQDEVIGALDIQSKQVDAFSQENIAVFQSLANQIALAVQNTRLIEEAQVNLMQLELIIAEQGTAAWSEHLEKKSYGYVYTPVGVKALRGENAEIRDRANLAKAEAPITLRGRKIGALSLQRLSSDWTPKERALINDVATQVGLAIENARLLNETREQARQEQLVSEISSRFRETLDMDTVIRTAVEELQKTFNLKEVEVRLLTADGEEKL